MSLEELWQLFPIFLVEHKSEWKDWYELEKTSLKKILGANLIKRIEHIGSTAIPNIWAKNIVDILLEVGRIEDLARVRDLLVKNGWLVMSESPNRISLNKGYTDQGSACAERFVWLLRFDTIPRWYHQSSARTFLSCPCPSTLPSAFPR